MSLIDYIADILSYFHQFTLIEIAESHFYI